MGLDMYLVKGDKDGNVNWGNIEEVGYWRKANHIHKWFVDNVQNGIDDCGEYAVSKDKIEQLLTTCQTVLANLELVEGDVVTGYTYQNGEMTPNIKKGAVVKNAKIAEKMLPTASGFFFGGTDYDMYYVRDLEGTIKILQDVLETFDFDNNVLIYSSSW